MAVQIIDAVIGVRPDAQEIELLRELSGIYGRASLVVPHAGMRDACRRALADAGAGVGVDVVTPSAWVSALWELSGDGRRIVEPAERRLVLAQLLGDASASASGGSLPFTTGSLEMLAAAARLHLPFVSSCDGASLTASELAVLGLLSKYARRLEELGLVELSQAAVILAHEGEGGVPGVHAVAVRALDDMPEYLLCLFDACAQIAPLVFIEDGLAADVVGSLEQRFGCASVHLEQMHHSGFAGASCVDQNASGVPAAPGFSSDGAATAPRGRSSAVLPGSRLEFAEIAGPSARANAYAGLIVRSVESAASPATNAAGEFLAGTTASASDAPTIAVAAPDPVAAYRMLAARLAIHGMCSELTVRLPFEDTRAGQALSSFEDLLRRMESEEPSSWWPAPEVPDWIRSPFSGLSHAAPRIARMLDSRLRKTRKLDAAALMAELKSLESREANRERKLAEEEGREPRPIAVAAVPEALAAGHPARALSLMAKVAAAAGAHAFGQEGRAALTAELSALDAANALMDIARHLGVSEAQALLALPGLAVGIDEVAVADAGGRCGHVLFLSAEELARRTAGTFDAVVLIDMDADAYPLARRETPLDMLAAKLDCQGIQAGSSVRHRIQMRRACSAGRSAVLAHTAHDRNGDERYAALAYDELKAALGNDASVVSELPHEGALFANLDPAGGAGARLFEATVPSAYSLAPDLARFLLLPTRSMGGVEVPRTLSASQIEAYLACPYSWLVGNRAATRRLDVGFGPIEMGNFVHDVMQRFHERLQEEGFVRVDNGNLDACLMQMDLAFAEMRADHARGKYTHGKYAREERPRAIRGPLVPLDELERNQIESMLPVLHEVVRHEADLMPSFIPAWFEYAFDKEGIAYAGRPLGGRIDRIDVAPAAGIRVGSFPERCERDRFVVIDYKNRSSVAALSCADPTMTLEEGHELDAAWLPGRDADKAPKVQTLIYAQALQSMGFGSAQGALYLGTRGPQVAGQVTDTLADSEPPSFPHDKVSGFPGVKSPRSRGALHDGTMAFTSLLDQVEQAIASELDALERGRIAPAPASDSCTYCPLTMCERRR